MKDNNESFSNKLFGALEVPEEKQEDACKMTKHQVIFIGKLLAELTEALPNYSIKYERNNPDGTKSKMGYYLISNREDTMAVYSDIACLYQKGADNEFIQKRCRVITESIRNIFETVHLNGNDIMDYEKVKNRIIPCVMNAEDWKNKNYVKRKFLDLMVSYRIHMPELNGYIAIKNSYLGIYGVSEKELFKQSYENFKKKYLTASIPEVLGIEENTFTDVLEDLYNSELIVCTEQRKQYGASVLLFPDLLKETMRQHGFEKIYIIPSTVSEVLIFKAREDDNIDELRSMIRDVNSQLPRIEFLSNNVYTLSLDSESVEIVE